MLIIGCDFHTRYQQIAMAHDETGELLVERRLDHENGEAEAFYRSLPKPARIGIEATGLIHWFERLLAELGHELWIGDSAKIRASEVRKQKTDERDARLILDLLLAKRFPKIWVPTAGERDLRQLLWHRHKLVTLRTMLGNQLHFLAMSQGLCRKQRLFSKKGRIEFTGLALGPWASRRREELLKLLDQLDPTIAELDRAVLQEAKRREDAALLMTHPGIGPNTALAFVLAIGSIARFSRSKKIASYLGLNPSEESSGGRRRLGAISKQGNTMVRWLLIETVHHAVRQEKWPKREYSTSRSNRESSTEDASTGILMGRIRSLPLEPTVTQFRSLSLRSVVCLRELRMPHAITLIQMSRDSTTNISRRLTNGTQETNMYLPSWELRITGSKNTTQTLRLNTASKRFPNWYHKMNIQKIFITIALVALFTVPTASQKYYKPRNGFVPDEKTAIRVAEAVLIPIYGEKRIKSEKPFSAKLDHGVWTVTGAIADGVEGGVAKIKISKSTGAVMSVTHGM